MRTLSGNRRTSEARDDVGEGGALRRVGVERDDDEILDVPGHVRRDDWPPRPVSDWDCMSVSILPSRSHKSRVSPSPQRILR